MKEIYRELHHFLKEEDKQNALAFCMKLLEEKRLTVVELYENILTPALNSIIEEYFDPDELIWREHVRSGIIRTIIESAYTFVIQERGQLDRKKSVIVMCPQYEHHELGARMVKDFFTIAGYYSVFLGAMTPEKTLLKAIEMIRPTYLSISVTNYFNLVDAKNTIEVVNKHTDERIYYLVGGNAFKTNPTSYLDIGGDLLLHSYDDIKNLHKEVLEK